MSNIMKDEDRVLFEKLSNISIDTISGLLMGMGYPDTYIEEIMPITSGTNMVGRARTLRYLPVRQDLSDQMTNRYRFSLLHHAIENIEPGDVLMVDAGGCTGSGFIGDVMLSRMIVLGGAGIVVDGAIRDLTVVRDMGYPIYTRGVHAAVSQRRLIAVDYQVCVKCSEVTVMPGDIVVGNDEGAVVIPAELAEEVAESGTKIEHKEIFLRKVIEEGERPLHEVYPPDEEVLKAYEAYKAAGN